MYAFAALTISVFDRLIVDDLQTKTHQFAFSNRPKPISVDEV